MAALVTVNGGLPDIKFLARIIKRRCPTAPYLSDSVEPFGQRSTFAMYKMEINVSGQQRIFVFRGPGCRKAMLEWWRGHLHRADAGEDIRSIRVLGTVGNKTDVVLEWPQARAARSERAQSQQRSIHLPHDWNFPE